MYGKAKVLFVVLILSALVLGCTTPTEKTVKAGDTVFVDYTLMNTNGTVLETTNSTIAHSAGIYNAGTKYEPMSFLAGSGMMIPGFEEAVIGMKINETKNVTLLPSRAYGEYNQSLIITTPTLKSTNVSMYIGDIGQYLTVNGENAKLLAIDAANNTMTLDYNNQMAGKTLVFDITVTDIKSK